MIIISFRVISQVSSRSRTKELLIRFRLVVFVCLPASLYHPSMRRMHDSQWSRVVKLQNCTFLFTGAVHASHRHASNNEPHPPQSLPSTRAVLASVCVEPVTIMFRCEPLNAVASVPQLLRAVLLCQISESKYTVLRSCDAAEMATKNPFHVLETLLAGGWRTCEQERCQVQPRA